MEETEYDLLEQQMNTSGLMDAPTDTGGSFQDYMITNSAFGMDIYAPEAKTSYRDTKGALDFKEKNFKAYFESQPIETQRAMTEAESNEDAFKIGQRRAIQEDSMARIAQDPIITQLVKGFVPGIANYSSVLPVAAIGGTLLKSSANATRILATAGNAAIAGGVANVLDEAVFDARSMHYDYGQAFLYGAAFSGILGGAAGTLDHMFRGPYAQRNAEIIAQDRRGSDDFDQDVDLEFNENGQLQPTGVDVASIEKNIFDRLFPYLTDDVHKAAMSESQALRNVVNKVAASVVAKRDASGAYVPQTETAMSIRRDTEGLFNITDVELRNIFYEAKKSGYAGNRKQFDNEMSEAYLDIANKQEIAAYEAGNRAAEQHAREVGIINLDEKVMNTIRRDARNEFYSKPLDWGNTNKDVVRAADVYIKYYDDVAKKGAGYGMKVLQDVPKGKVYKTRMIDYNKVDPNGNRDLLSAIRTAFDNHPDNRRLSTEDFDLLVNHYFNFINDAKFKQNFTHNSFTLPSATELPAASRLKGRKFRLDETALKDYLVTDVRELSTMYSRGMSGRMGLQGIFGTDKFHEVMDDLKIKMIVEGNAHLTDDIKALDKSLRDVSNELRLNPLSGEIAWTLTRSATAMNSLRFGGRFGINQAVELAGNMAMNHLPSMMKSGIGDNFRQAKALMFNKDGKLNNDLAEMLMNMGYLQDALSNHHINRAADVEYGVNPGKFESGLQAANNTFFKYNGMRFIKTFQELMVGGALMRELPMLANKTSLSGSDLARVASWGLTPDTLRMVAGDIDAHYDPKTHNFNLGNFSEESAHLLQLAMKNNMERSVLQGDSLYVPSTTIFNFKDGNIMHKLMLQFMRFPAMAHNVYLRRGMSQETGRLAGAAVGNVMAYMFFRYLQEEASVALGFTEDYERNYDFFGPNSEEHLMTGVQKSLNYTASIGMLSTVWNYGAHLSGNSQLGSDYISKEGVGTFIGPSGDMADAIIDLGRYGLGGKNLTDERAALKVQSLTIGSNLPIWQEFWKGYIEDNL